MDSSIILSINEHTQHTFFLTHITCAFLFVFCHSHFCLSSLGTCAVWSTQRMEKLFAEDRYKRLDDLGDTHTKYLPGFISNWGP